MHYFVRFLYDELYCVNCKNLGGENVEYEDIYINDFIKSLVIVMERVPENYEKVLEIFIWGEGREYYQCIRPNCRCCGSWGCEWLKKDEVEYILEEIIASETISEDIKEFARKILSKL